MSKRSVIVGRKLSFTIEFNERELIADELQREASRLDITVEQLIKRFIVDAMESDDSSPGVPGETLEDFLVKNGALRPKTDD
tara:strand:+ start:159 stop:404 length:246 start_codon:yes stop_codon:yes gene_type:complete